MNIKDRIRYSADTINNSKAAPSVRALAHQEHKDAVRYAHMADIPVYNREACLEYAHACVRNALKIIAAGGEE
jgi:hypothetical protein